MRRARVRDDAGESLIELLVTIVVIGITVPAILGAALISVSASAQNRRQVQAQSVLTAWTDTIAQQNKTDASYPICPPASYYATAPFAPSSVPAGFTVSVAAISYWDTSSGTFTSACPAVDSGAQRVQLSVQVPAGVHPSFTVNRSIVVRKLCLAC